MEQININGNGSTNDDSLLKDRGAKRIWIVRFPFMKLAVHEMSDNIFIITINEMVFVFRGNESDAKNIAIRLMLEAHEKLTDSISEFIKNETKIVDDYDGTNEKPFIAGDKEGNQSDAPPEIH